MKKHGKEQSKKCIPGKLRHEAWWKEDASRNRNKHDDGNSGLKNGL